LAGAEGAEGAGGSGSATKDAPVDAACQYADYQVTNAMPHSKWPVHQHSVQDYQLAQHLQTQHYRQHQHQQAHHAHHTQQHHTQQQRSGAVSTGPFGSWGTTAHGNPLSYVAAPSASTVQRSPPHVSTVSNIARIWDAFTAAKH